MINRILNSAKVTNDGLVRIHSRDLPDVNFKGTLTFNSFKSLYEFLKKLYDL